MAKEKYDVLSPDGFSIEREKVYQSKQEALKALNTWMDRYAHQGYYSSMGRRIPLSELEENCEIVLIK